MFMSFIIKMLLLALQVCWSTCVWMCLECEACWQGMCQGKHEAVPCVWLWICSLCVIIIIIKLLTLLGPGIHHSSSNRMIAMCLCECVCVCACVLETTEDVTIIMSFQKEHYILLCVTTTHDYYYYYYLTLFLPLVYNIMILSFVHFLQETNN